MESTPPLAVQTHMHLLRRRRIASAAITASTATALLVAGCRVSPTSSALSDFRAGPASYCMASRQPEPMTSGLTYFRNTTDRPVRITSVALVGDKNLRLLGAWILPIAKGSAAFGNIGGVPPPTGPWKASGASAVWSVRRSLPMTVEGGQSQLWQVVVSVVPKSPRTGKARGVAVRYKVGGSSGVLRGDFGVAVVVGAAQCSRQVY